MKAHVTSTIPRVSLEDNIEGIMMLGVSIDKFDTLKKINDGIKHTLDRYWNGHKFITI